MVPGLQSTGSIVEVHGLSWSAACGLFPDQGLNPRLLHWQAALLPSSHEGSPGLFNWKIYGLVGGGASFVLLAPDVREGCFLYLLIYYLFILPCSRKEFEEDKTLWRLASSPVRLR